MAFEKSESGLVRSLSLKDSVMIGVASMIGGAIFVGSQAWEWKNFIKGEYGAVETRGGQILQFLSAEEKKRVSLSDFAIGIPTERSTQNKNDGIWFKTEKSLPEFSIDEVKKGFKANPNILIRIQKIEKKQVF